MAPTATFEEAITLMLLNDYSQLAVLSGAHTLRGAVTWKSIAQTRHASPSASFPDAIVRAHEARYDQELIDVLATLEASDFAFVRDEKNADAGIVTTADVVRAYGDLAIRRSVRPRPVLCRGLGVVAGQPLHLAEPPAIS